MSLDMKTKIFNREEVNSMINGLGMLGYGPPAVPRDWTMHVGPGTIATLTFKGPVGADEWDALLAHIAFYKQWYKDTPTTPLMNLQDAVDAIAKKITAPKDDETSSEMGRNQT